MCYIVLVTLTSSDIFRDLGTVQKLLIKISLEDFDALMLLIRVPRLFLFLVSMSCRKYGYVERKWMHIQEVSLVIGRVRLEFK